jgi:chorismate mutase / prephenate dehydrogenase
LERLEALRQRIRRLDAALLALVSERMELAVEIGEAKRQAGIPLRDYAVEKNVLARAAATAADLGLEPALARAVTALLIEEACRLQEERHFSGFTGDAETVLVVGGDGKMGGWLAGFLGNQGHHVRIFDPVRATAPAGAPAGAPGTVVERVATLAAGLRGASMAVVATPLERVPATLAEVTALGFDGVLWDIASLKSHLRPELERARSRGIAVTSAHPMFGPGARTLAGRVVCLCDCGDVAATTRVEALFRETAATLVPLSLDQHDRIAGYVLGLSHLVNLVFARVLAESGVSLETLQTVTSTTFQTQLDATAGVIGDNAELYFDIQRLNPNTPAIHAAAARALESWRREVASADRAAFARAMASSREWLAAGGTG